MGIKITDKTKQDFLNRTWSQKLLNAGINMDDAKYVIVQEKEEDYVYLKEDMPIWKNNNGVPTYTLSELLYKLFEWQVWENNDGKKCNGPLAFMKDAPFYFFYYKEYLGREGDKNPYGQSYLECEHESPLYCAAMLLLQCVKNNLPYVKDISNKTI